MGLTLVGTIELTRVGAIVLTLVGAMPSKAFGAKAPDGCEAVNAMRPQVVSQLIFLRSKESFIGQIGSVGVQGFSRRSLRPTNVHDSISLEELRSS
jgi:hypothetical protein